MTEWMLAHPYLAFIGWCWAWFWFSIGLPPFVSVRPHTPKERKKLDNQEQET